ncbi:hypothetical protein BASA81_013742 [Batrachochytrium salamandrivorans]|nr:hypothetical protein BASA81_013742 [Batrachochytrium salamandrivorans]
MLPAAAAAVATGVLVSETAYKAERNLAPMTASRDYVLPHQIFPGPKPDSPVLVFLHGWPDDITVFQPYAQKLSSEYHCVNCGLPGYDLPFNFAGHRGTIPNRQWGFGLDEVVWAWKATIDLALQDRPNSDGGVTLVAHDWGCILAHLLVASGLIKVNRIVSLDVGSRPGGWTPMFLALCIAYQLLLCVFFMLPKVVGDLLTSVEVVGLGRPQFNTQGFRVSASRNYPYRAAWREWFSTEQKINIRQGFYFSPPPDLPYLFLYCELFPKSARFYDQTFVDAVCAGSKRSKAIAMPGTHWFVGTHPEETMAHIAAFLHDSD